MDSGKSFLVDMTTTQVISADQLAKVQHAVTDHRSIDIANTFLLVGVFDCPAPSLEPCGFAFVPPVLAELFINPSPLHGIIGELRHVNSPWIN